MKKSCIVFGVLFCLFFLMGCGPVNEVVEEAVKEPSAEEVLVMYEEAIKGNSEALIEYFGTIPEVLSDDATYEEVIEKQPTLAGYSPEQMEILSQRNMEAHADSIFTNEAIDENEDLASFNVTVSNGRNFTPAIDEMNNYRMSQAEQGVFLSEKEVYDVVLANMATLYTVAEPQTATVNLIKNAEGKWEMSDSNVEKLMSYTMVFPE